MRLVSVTGESILHYHYVGHVDETVDFCTCNLVEPYIVDGVDEYPSCAAVCIFHHANPSADPVDHTCL